MFIPEVTFSIWNRRRVIALSGHIEGSIGIDVPGSFLIVGAALMNLLYPSLPQIYHNFDEVLKSGEKITSLGNRMNYFGHGRTKKNREWIKNK